MSQQTASQQIHPTAVVDPKAELASGVVIGPGAVVGPEVVIGENTWIGPHAVLDGRLTLGRDNKVYPGACLGLPPQDLKYRGANTEVLIGDGNTMRECVTINRATEEGEVTRIGHQQVAVADAGHLTLFGSAVDRHAFPQGVSITDQHFGIGTAVLEILRRKPKAGTRVDLVVTAQGQPAIQDGMGTDPGVLTDHHLRADHRTRADDHAGGQLRLRVHHRRGMDLL